MPPAMGACFFLTTNKFLSSLEKKEKERARKREYAKKHPEKVYAWNKKYRQAHREKLQEQDTARKARKYKTDAVFLFREYKRGAKKRDIFFGLTPVTFAATASMACYYCGSHECLNGIDRIDSTKGYTEDNIVPCCSMCNYMKQDYTHEEFIEQCKRIAKKFS